MSKKNDDFFKQKKAWSKVKDELLGCYLKPYFQKILTTHHSIVYVDCFAGKGRFEDGNPGSPIIALDIMKDCIQQTKVESWKIQSYFIELNHSKELTSNLKNFSNVRVISGKYEEQISSILKGKEGSNVFLYIDPYGIKALDCDLLDSFAQRNFFSIELLINMNSWGFIREGCRVLGVPFDENEILSDLVEYDTVSISSEKDPKSALSRIAGGDYWIDIINKKKQGIITAYQAENLFTEMFCERMRKTYKYVLNMPVRLKEGHVPKYRMIHATKHSSGAILMVDNIFERLNSMRNIQSKGQLSLWEVDADDREINMSEIEDKVVNHLKQNKIFRRLNDILAEFYSLYGVVCKSKDIKEIYKKLEKNGKIEVNREPAVTTLGNPTKFFADEKRKATCLRWKE